VTRRRWWPIAALAKKARRPFRHVLRDVHVGLLPARLVGGSYWLVADDVAAVYLAAHRRPRTGAA
jgi:hypothetical protein